MTFIIHFKDGHRETYSNHYDDPERDAAWDDVNQANEYAKEEDLVVAHLIDEVTWRGR